MSEENADYTISCYLLTNEIPFYSSYNTSTGITNLSTHLSNRHNKLLNTSTRENNQRSLGDIFFPSTKRTKKDNENVVDPNYVFARQIALWHCRNLVPFHQVQKEGFQYFMKSINPKQSLPSRATISIAALDDLYSCVKQKFIEKISKSPEHGTITMDFWSDKHHHIAYVTYTFHFMADWSMHSAVLKTALFDRPHTGVRVKADLEKTMKEFGLLNKNITAVTDCGSSLISACNLMNFERFGCINHAIHNLITVDFLKSKDVDIKPLKGLIEKLKLTQYKLTYKHRELQAFDDEKRQQKMLDVIEQYCDIRKL